ncbi:MAG: formyltransferase family protein [Thermodesulfobacteriota bacterium]|jgi:folate-dependent phosphoribosylglycinamide formyltransferase PurN
MENEIKAFYIPKSTIGTDKINLVLIASGSGTDANSIMEAWEAGCIPEINPPLLISTKKGVGCLEKAKNHQVRSEVMDYKEMGGMDLFNAGLNRMLKQNVTDLIFLVGCIHMIYPIEGIDMYNIHPADPAKHGGDKMYGLAVHQHVLEEIKDLIYRGKKKTSDKFYTYPTVHVASAEYDGGDMLLRQAVLIPQAIVKDYCDGLKDPQKVAKDLQDVVLPYEWRMLPAAVRMSARRILERRNDHV